jgi:hypothetical protein
MTLTLSSGLIQFLTLLFCFGFQYLNNQIARERERERERERGKKITKKRERERERERDR